MSPPCGPSLFFPISETFHNRLQFETSPKLSSELHTSASTTTILDGSSINSTRSLQFVTSSFLSRGTRKTLKFNRVKIFYDRSSPSKLGNSQTTEPMSLSPTLQTERFNLKHVGRNQDSVWWFMLL